MDHEQYTFINIDDEWSIENDSASKPSSYLDVDSFSSLKAKIEKDPDFLNRVLSGKSTVIIGIDEHLPWDEFQGMDVYQGLGLFLSTHAKNPAKVFILGTSSNEAAQNYIPRENRLAKRFYAYTSSPEQLIENLNPQNVLTLFKSNEYKTPKGGIEYSEKALRISRTLESLARRSGRDEK